MSREFQPQRAAPPLVEAPPQKTAPATAVAAVPIWHHLPNLISLLRFAAVPVVAWAILAEQPVLAFGLFVAAGISDAIDGGLARLFRAHSRFGTYVDPAADKALLLTIYAMLAMEGDLPVWVAVLVFARDAMILGGVAVSLLKAESYDIRPFFISKVNTVLQVVLAAWLLGCAAFGVTQPSVTHSLIVVVAITTIASGIRYALHWGRRNRGTAPNRQAGRS